MPHDSIKEIPDSWWEGHDGQSLVVDYDKVAALIKAARGVLKEWQFASLHHQPMIDELVRLREALEPPKS